MGLMLRLVLFLLTIGESVAEYTGVMGEPVTVGKARLCEASVRAVSVDTGGRLKLSYLSCIYFSIILSYLTFG